MSCNKKNEQYKKLEYSLSSDPSKMYISSNSVQNSNKEQIKDSKNNVNNENNENITTFSNIKKLVSGNAIIKGFYNIIGNNSYNKSIDIEELSITDSSNQYMSINLPEDNDIIEDYIGKNKESCIGKADTIESDNDERIFETEKSYFECFEDDKSINNVINYKDDTIINFGYVSGCYNEPSKESIYPYSLNLFPKYNYSQSENINSEDNVGKYSIYTLSTIIIMSSVYVAKTL
jgi:hypothetical protein